MMELQHQSRMDLPVWMVALLFVLIAIFVFVLLVGLILRHLRIRRQFLHEERMKTIELGRSVEPSAEVRVRDRAVRNAFWIAFWVGGVVPIASVIAAAVTVSNNPYNFNLGTVIWVAVGFIGVAGVASAALMIILSGRSRTLPPPVTLPAAVSAPPASPAPQETGGQAVSLPPANPT